MSIILFLVWAGLIVYVMLGYPILLAIVARFAARPVQRGDGYRPVSVVIPVRNGERFIAEKIESVLALDYPHDKMEILVISDGSSDGTNSIVREYSSRGIQLLELPSGGKSAALNAGIPRTKNEILLLTDVRQKLARDSLKEIVSCFADPSVGVVSGELLIRGVASVNEEATGTYWRYESWIRRNLSSVDSMFGATGPFYAIRRELVVPIPRDILLDDVYLPIAAFFRGYRLIVQPHAKAFDYPTSRETEFKRKVRTLAGNYQLLCAYPALLGPGNRMWFHFMSYKFLRLMLPWLFVLCFASSCFLPGVFRWIALGPQVLFYCAAAADPLIPPLGPFKRLCSFCRTVVALLLATIWGLRVFVVPPRSLWQDTKIASHHL